MEFLRIVPLGKNTKGEDIFTKDDDYTKVKMEQMHTPESIADKMTDLYWRASTKGRQGSTITVPITSISGKPLPKNVLEEEKGEKLPGLLDVILAKHGIKSKNKPLEKGEVFSVVSKKEEEE